MKKLTDILLTLLLLVLLGGFALAVPNGRLDDEKSNEYRQEQMSEDDDSWLLNY